MLGCVQSIVLSGAGHSVDRKLFGQRHIHDMSLFDNIFDVSAQAGANPLFSSNSKFKAVSAARGSAVFTAEDGALDRPEPAKSINVSAVKSSKVDKAKKRKAVEAKQPPLSELPARQKKQKQQHHVDAASHEAAHANKKQKVTADANGTDIVNSIKPAKKRKQPAESNSTPSVTKGAAAAEQASASAIDSVHADRSEPASSNQVQVQSKSSSAHTDGPVGLLTHADMLAMLMRVHTLQRLTPEEEAAKLRRTIFVGNLPSDVKKKMILKEFDQ